MNIFVKHSLLFAGAALMLVACDGKQPPGPVTGPPPVILPLDYEWLPATAADQATRSVQGLQIVDLREEWERTAEGGIAGSVPMPFFMCREKGFAQFDSMDINAPVLVYCAVGGRAELAAKELAARKFKKVYLLKGGFRAWRAAGLPGSK